MLPRYKVIGPLVSLTFVLWLLGACGQTSEPPMVSEISVEPGTTILMDESASLTVRASGTDLQFKWTVSRGSLSSATAPSVLYTAPDSSGPDTVTVEVVSRGGTTVRSIAFEVIPQLASAQTLTATRAVAPGTPTRTVISSPTVVLTYTPSLTKTYVFDFSDGIQCWNVRTEFGGERLGDRVSVTTGIGDNTTNVLKLDAKLNDTTEYRSQIEFSSFYGCLPEVIDMLTQTVEFRSDVFLPEDTPDSIRLEFWVQEGERGDWRWYAGPRLRLEPGGWVTTRWNVGIGGPLWRFPYQFGIEVNSEGEFYRGPVYFDNIAITYGQ